MKPYFKERRLVLRLAASLIEFAIDHDDDFRQEELSSDSIDEPTWRRRKRAMLALVGELRRRGKEPVDAD